MNIQAMGGHNLVLHPERLEAIRPHIIRSGLIDLVPGCPDGDTVGVVDCTMAKLMQVAAFSGNALGKSGRRYSVFTANMSGVPVDLLALPLGNNHHSIVTVVVPDASEIYPTVDPTPGFVEMEYTGPAPWWSGGRLPGRRRF